MELTAFVFACKVDTPKVFFCLYLVPGFPSSYPA